ncbi:hypothetical protein KM043_013893 [Ampulex compressa]|nr:hypothetical protein KM043_013893 [Ampulex compressa]
MCIPTFKAGKLETLIRAEAALHGNNYGLQAENRLYMYDRSNNLSFLIDSSSVVTMIPKELVKTRLDKQPLTLYAANTTEINTFGEKVLTLDLGLHRQIRWSFIIADIKSPIIGADFIAHHGILLDLQNRSLIDSVTRITPSGIIRKTYIHSISTINPNTGYTELFEQFSEVTKLSMGIGKAKDPTVAHHIETEGTPVAHRPRRLFMDSIFRDLNFVIVYIDDILIASKDEEEHQQHLRMVLSRLQAHGLKINPNKCVVRKPELVFLGYTIKKDGVKPPSKRIQTILDYQKVETIGDLRRFLRLVNFYQRCKKNLAEVQVPVNEFLKDSKKNDTRPVLCTLEADIYISLIRRIQELL